MNEEMNKLERKKAEILNISSELYRLCLRTEQKILQPAILVETVAGLVFLLFDWEDELIWLVVNGIAILVLLLLLSRATERRLDLLQFIDQVKRNVLPALLVQWAHVKLESSLPFSMGQLRTVEKWLLVTLQDKMEHYDTSGLLKETRLEPGTGIRVVHPPARFLFYGLALFALLSTLVKAMETTTRDHPGTKVAGLTFDAVAATPWNEDSLLFSLALKQANIPREEKIDKNLVDIQPATLPEFETDSLDGEAYIKVYTLKDKDYYSKSTHDSGWYNTKGRYTWVFTKADFFRKYKLYGREDSLYRVKQLMGLPVTQEINVVACFLVRPKDLFRPCPDPEINDCECTVSPPVSRKAKVFLADWQKQVYNNAGLFSNYPFTALGYTFDWSPYNFSHVGVSEFVIERDREVKLVEVIGVQQFLRN